MNVEDSAAAIDLIKCIDLVDVSDARTWNETFFKERHANLYMYTNRPTLRIARNRPFHIA